MSDDDLMQKIVGGIDEGSELKFSSLGAIRKWIDAELAAWKWLGENNFRLYGNLFDRVSGPITPIRQHLGVVESDPANQGEVNNLKSRLQTLDKQMRAGRYVSSHSLSGKMILSLAAENQGLAAVVYHLESAEPGQNLNFTPELGIAAGILSMHRLGISKRTATVAVKSLEGSRENFDAFIQEADGARMKYESAFSSLLDESERKRERVSSLIAGRIRTVRAKTAAAKEELVLDFKSAKSDLLQRTESEIAEFKDFLEKQIALQVPSSYWHKKRYWHRLGTAATGVLFTSYIGLLVILSYVHVSYVYGDLSSFLDHWRDAGFGVFGLIAGIAAFSLILARVLYRLFASQLHLWNDASERITMIQTYLALSEKGHAKEEFLGALMTRLFAPASDGVVRDDLGTIGPLDLASQLAYGRR